MKNHTATYELDLTMEEYDELTRAFFYQKKLSDLVCTCPIGLEALL